MNKRNTAEGISPSGSLDDGLQGNNCDGEVVKRFGFHVLGRHSIATFLMDEQENPAVVQAVMRHATMDMTLYYAHSRRKAKRAAQEKVMERLIPDAVPHGGLREPVRVPQIVQ